MRATVSPIRFIRYVLFAVILIFGAQTMELQAQATLSIQGILKKSNGVAVDDGNYTITFKLYTVVAGGTAIWTETQNDVEVSSGIYSAVLGSSTVLNVPFNQLYYLGVTIGSTELTPRILLTSAPYALSLIGVTNKFPSSGKVEADSIQVNGGVLARGGVPGLNGASKNGYAFTGSGGDKDSGLFSTANGEVSLYANNTEILEVTPAKVESKTDMTVLGSITSNDIAINNNGSVSYNGLNDWRLVAEDYFESGADGWQYSQDDPDDRGAWKNGLSGACPVEDFGDFAGKVLRPANNDYVVKKQFSPSGSYSQVKVVFKYFVIGNWDPGDVSSRAFAAFANDATGGGIRVGWTGFDVDMGQVWTYDYDLFKNASSFVNTPANTSDHWNTGTMMGTRSTPFWVYFGYGNNEGDDSEMYAIGGVEIWVK